MSQDLPVTTPTDPPHEGEIQRELRELRGRLLDEGAQAVSMFERALQVLWDGDVKGAKEIRKRERRLDAQEVAIEERALRLLALHQPVARDFREVTFIVKANSDFERIADHAWSIAKQTQLLTDALPSERWPTALVELRDRVPIQCHALLKAMTSENIERAQTLLEDDEVIDNLHELLFDETVEMMRRTPGNEAAGLSLYRIGRDLERVGDLVTNIAEGIIYLETGTIVRHTKLRDLPDAIRRPAE